MPGRNDTLYHSPLTLPSLGLPFLMSHPLMEATSPRELYLPWHQWPNGLCLSLDILVCLLSPAVAIHLLDSAWVPLPVRTLGDRET